MLWAYLSFSQLLIIWSGDIPEEIAWYLSRLRHGWEWTAAVLITFQFFVPWFLLLSRRNKRNVEALVYRAAGARHAYRRYVLDDHAGILSRQFTIHWLDLIALAGIGGIWLAMYARQLSECLCWRSMIRTRFPIKRYELGENKTRHDHERSDWNLKWVIGSFAILVISVTVLIAGSWWVFRDFQFAAANRQMGTVRGTPINSARAQAPGVARTRLGSDVEPGTARPQLIWLDRPGSGTRPYSNRTRNGNGRPARLPC